MLPWMMGIGALGSIIGGIGGRMSSSAISAEQMRIAALERQAEEQRHKAMVLQARRQSTEIVRNQQRANAMALNAATNQGAQLGTGLQGGYGQISGQTATNLAGVNQNLEIGNNTFEINKQISNSKMHLAQLGGEANMWQGIGNLGGSVMKIAGPLGNMTSGRGNSGAGGGGDYNWIPRPQDAWNPWSKTSWGWN